MTVLIPKDLLSGLSPVDVFNINSKANDDYFTYLSGWLYIQMYSEYFFLFLNHVSTCLFNVKKLQYILL